MKYAPTVSAEGRGVFPYWTLSKSFYQPCHALATSKGEKKDLWQDGNWECASKSVSSTSLFHRVQLLAAFARDFDISTASSVLSPQQT